MTDLVPALENAVDLFDGNAVGGPEALQNSVEALKAIFAIPALPRRDQGHEHRDPLLVQELVQFCAALQLLQEGKRLPDFLFRSADPLEGGLDQVNPPELMVLHTELGQWLRSVRRSAIERQAGKEAA